MNLYTKDPHRLPGTLALGFSEKGISRAALSRR